MKIFATIVTLFCSQTYGSIVGQVRDSHESFVKDMLGNQHDLAERISTTVADIESRVLQNITVKLSSILSTELAEARDVFNRNSSSLMTELQGINTELMQSIKELSIKTAAAIRQAEAHAGFESKAKPSVPSQNSHLPSGDYPSTHTVSNAESLGIDYDAFRSFTTVAGLFQSFDYLVGWITDSAVTLTERHALPHVKRLMQVIGNEELTSSLVSASYGQGMHTLIKNVVYSSCALIVIVTVNKLTRVTGPRHAGRPDMKVIQEIQQLKHLIATKESASNHQEHDHNRGLSAPEVTECFSSALRAHDEAVSTMILHLGTAITELDKRIELQTALCNDRLRYLITLQSMLAVKATTQHYFIIDAYSRTIEMAADCFDVIGRSDKSENLYALAEYVGAYIASTRSQNNFNGCMEVLRANVDLEDALLVQIERIFNDTDSASMDFPVSLATREPHLFRCHPAVSQKSNEHPLTPNSYIRQAEDARLSQVPISATAHSQDLPGGFQSAAAQFEGSADPSPTYTSSYNSRDRKLNQTYTHHPSYGPPPTSGGSFSRCESGQPTSSPAISHYNSVGLNLDEADIIDI